MAKLSEPASRRDKFWMGIVAPVATWAAGLWLLLWMLDALEPHDFAQSWWFFPFVELPVILIVIGLVRSATVRAWRVWHGEAPTKPARAGALALPLDGGYTDGWCVAFLAAPGRRLDVLSCLSARGVEPSAAVEAAYEAARPVVVGICLSEVDARALATELGEAGAMVAVIRGERFAKAGTLRAS